MAGTNTAGFSPDGQFQPSSLPSSISDPLEGVIGQSLEDLSLEELDPNVQLGAGGGGGSTGGNDGTEVGVVLLVY